MELTDITSIFTQVSSLQGIALLAAALVVLGYVLKGLPFIPNGTIPAIVILAGGIINPLLSAVGNVPPDVGSPILHLALQGIIAGFVAWVFHNKLLSKWIDPAVFKGAPVLLGLAVLLAGCAGLSPKAKAYVALRDTQIAVDKAMKVYGAAYAAGKISAEVRDEVHAKHAKYRGAFEAAVTLAEFDFAQPTPEAVATAATALLGIIAQLKL
jgi:hypothetical protein